MPEIALQGRHHQVFENYRRREKPETVLNASRRPTNDSRVRRCIRPTVVGRSRVCHTEIGANSCVNVCPEHCYGSFWHEAVEKPRPLFGRFRGESRRGTHRPKSTQMDPQRTCDLPFLPIVLDRYSATLVGSSTWGSALFLQPWRL